MAAKEVRFSGEAREKLLCGVDILADAVRVTGSLQQAPPAEPGYVPANRDQSADEQMSFPSCTTTTASGRASRIRSLTVFCESARGSDADRRRGHSSGTCKIKTLAHEVG
jgi:hypothetical protein